METVTNSAEITPLISVPDFPPHPPREVRGARGQIPRIAAITATAAGLMTLISSATRPFSGRMQLIEDVIPLDARVGARFVSVLIGLTLLVLARELNRRKHRAWLATTAASGILVITHVLKGLDIEEAGVHLLLLGILIYGRKEFYAKSDPPSLGQLVRFVPIYMGGVFAFGIAVLALNRNTVSESLSFGNATATVTRAMVGLNGPVTLRTSAGESFFVFSMAALTAVGLLVAIYLFFRPVLEGLVSHDDERERAADLVRTWGSDTLAYFTLRDDKNYFFSAGGDAMVAYRYLNGIACISGDPVGNPSSIPEMLIDFQEHAWQRGWKVAVLAGREDHASLYEPLGLRSYYIGDEAIVNLDSFTLEGRRIRKVRQSCHRLTKAGYVTEVMFASDIDEELARQLEGITRKWRGKAPERGFSMALGRPFCDADHDCLLLLARDAEGRPRGFLRMVPFFGSHPGYSLDQMRRDPETPNGLTEFMVVRACDDLRERGMARLSLNFAAFARLISGEIELSFWQKFQRTLVMRANPYFQIESLLTFNSKFFPDWVPRCLYYEDGVNLVRVGLSYLEIEAFLKLGILRHGLLPHLDL